MSSHIIPTTQEEEEALAEIKQALNIHDDDDKSSKPLSTITIPKLDFPSSFSSTMNQENNESGNTGKTAKINDGYIPAPMMEPTSVETESDSFLAPQQQPQHEQKMDPKEQQEEPTSFFRRGDAVIVSGTYSVLEDSSSSNAADTKTTTGTTTMDAAASQNSNSADRVVVNKNTSKSIISSSWDQYLAGGTGSMYGEKNDTNSDDDSWQSSDNDKVSLLQEGADEMTYEELLALVERLYDNLKQADAALTKERSRRTGREKNLIKLAKELRTRKSKMEELEEQIEEVRRALHENETKNG